LSKKQNNLFFQYKWLILLAGIALVLPFYVLAFYNYYSLDDYIFANNKKTLGFFNSILFNYNSYNGRYFTVALINLIGPIKGHEYLSFLTPVLLLSGLIYSVHYFIKTCFNDNDKYSNWFLALVILFPLIGLIKAPSEIIYWTSSGLCYTSGIILFFLFLSGLIKMRNETLTFKGFTGLSFIYVCLIGSNETITIIADLFLASFFIYDLIRKRRLNIRLIILGAIGVLFTLLVLIAPGNKERLAMSEPMFAFTVKHNIPENLRMCIEYLTKILYDWISNPLLIASSVFFFLWLFVIGKRGLSLKYFIWLVVTIAILIIGAFPPFYALGWNPPDRTTFVFQVFFILILGLLVYLIYSIVLIFKIQALRSIPTSFFYPFACCCLVLIALFSGTNIRYAYENIYSGKAAFMGREIKERFERINNASGDTVFLKDLVHKPEILFHGDLDMEDPSSWINECLSNYYGVKAVVLKPRENYNVYWAVYNNVGNRIGFDPNTPVDTLLFNTKNGSYFLDRNSPYTFNYTQKISDITLHRKVNRIKFKYKYNTNDHGAFYHIYMLVRNIKNKELKHQAYKAVKPALTGIGFWSCQEITFEVHQRSFFNKENELFFYFMNSNEKVKINFDDFLIQFTD
jgi:hypothetical protein